MTSDAAPAGAYEDVHVALIGCGNWGRHILRDLRALGVAVVVARSPDSIARALDGGATVVPDVGALGPVHGIVVATPTVTHAEVIESVLDREVPVFVEKPMTPDLESARRLCARAGERIFVMDKWRYHPGIETLGELARSGAHGRIQGVTSVRHQWGNPHDDVDAVWILAPHDLSIAVEILGHLPDPMYAVVDRAEGRITGMRALLGADPWHALSISARSATWDRSVQVHTEDALLLLPDSYAAHVSVYRSGGLAFGDPPEPERVAVSTALPLGRELEAFVAHLTGGPAPKTSAADGVAAVECLERLLALAGAGS